MHESKTPIKVRCFVDHFTRPQAAAAR